MSHVINKLESDLATLSNEAGRSLTAVKDAADIAVARLKTDRHAYVTVAQAALKGEKAGSNFKLEDVFRPLLLVCNHRNASPKLVVIALGSIQKLLQADVLDCEDRAHVTHVLAIQSQREKPVKDIQVKILQTLPLLLSGQHYAVTESILMDAIGLCCQFYNQDPGLASAALTQMLTGLFERIEEEDQYYSADVVMSSRDYDGGDSQSQLGQTSKALATKHQNEVGVSHMAKQPTPGGNSNERLRPIFAANRDSALCLLSELCVIVSNTGVITSPPSSSSISDAVSSPPLSGSKSRSSSPFFRSIGSVGGSAAASSLLSSQAAYHPSSSHAKGPPNSTSQNGAGPSLGAGFSPRLNVPRMPKSLALELLESILSGHSNLFSAPDFNDVVRNKICPVLVKAFRGQCDWRLMVRMMRTVVVLLSDIRETLEPEDVFLLLKLLLEMLDDAEGDGTYVTPLWHRVLTLETLNILCSQQDLLGELQTYMIPGGEVTAFIRVVNSLCKLVVQVVRQPQVAQGIDAIAARPTKGLELLSEEKPPSNLNESLVTLLAAECLASIADAMALSKSLSDLAPVVQIGRVQSRSELSPPPLLNMHNRRVLSSGGSFDGQLNTTQRSRNTSSMSQYNQSLNSAKRSDEVHRDVICDMMTSCWQPMLEALALLLEHCNNENIVQFILKAYMSMTNTCGILQLEDARNAFIYSLCTFSLPNWQSSAAILPQSKAGIDNNALQEKHLQALKALFNIAHGLGSILGTAWHIVLDTFEQLDHIMFCVAVEKKLTTTGTVHVTGIGPSSNGSFHPGGPNNMKVSQWHQIDDEMAIVESMLRFLFNSTKYLDDEALVHMQTALTQLSFTVLAHTETMRTLSRQELAAQAEHGISSPKSPSKPPQVVKREGWISSTVSNITSSIADAASATLTSVTFEKNQDTPSNFGDSGNHSPATSSPRRGDRISSRTASGSSTLASLSSPQRLSRGVSTESNGLFSPTEGSNFDGVLARATYRNPPFAIEKLVETTKLNTFRIALLWQMTENVLSTVASKSDAKLRLYGVQAMDDLVTTALLFNTNESTTPLSEETEQSSLPSREVATPEPEALSPGRVRVVLPTYGEDGEGDSESNSTETRSRNASSNATSTKASSAGDSSLHGYPLPKCMQDQLIEGFLHLFRSQYFDAREASVLSLHRIISTCGHVLQSAWSPIIQALGQVSGCMDQDTTDKTPKLEFKPDEVTKLVPSAFKAVQLIVDDFLQNLDVQCTKDLACCIRAFGDQVPHVNISLTAVTMLWTICDHLQNVLPPIDVLREGEKYSEVVERNNKLLLFVFEQLYRLSLDTRPEVRNCAVRTLCKIIVASAPKLTMDSWRICNMGILFPLLNEIAARGQQAPTEQVRGEVLGRFSGERARVHHSLDTLEKQWRETIVITLAESTRVVRATVQFVGQMDWSLKTWEIMLDTITTKLVARPQVDKIARAAARSLQELAALVTGSSKARFASVGMQVVNGALVRVDPGGPRNGESGALAAGASPLPLGTPVGRLWKMTWAVYEFACSRGEAGSNELQGIASPEVASEFASGLGELYANCNGNHILLTPETVSNVLRVLRALLAPFPANSKHITSLERAILGALESIQPVPDVVWPLILLHLRRYMVVPNSLGYSDAFAKKAEDLYALLIEKKVPPHAQALVFELTTEALTRGFDEMDSEAPTGGSDPEDDFGHAKDVVWDLRTVLPVFKSGLQSLSRCEWHPARINKVWDNLLETLDLILGRESEEDSPDNMKISMKDGLQMLDVVIFEVKSILQTSEIPVGVEDRLFALLHGGCMAVEDAANSDVSGADGASANSIEANSGSAGGGVGARSTTAQNNLLLSRACLDHILSLSTATRSESKEISERVLATLVSGVGQMVAAFSHKEMEESELVTVLTKLRELDVNIHPNNVVSQFSDDAVRSAGPKLHLLLLFPVLNKLVLEDSLLVRTEIYKIYEHLTGALSQ